LLIVLFLPLQELTFTENTLHFEFDASCLGELSLSGRKQVPSHQPFLQIIIGKGIAVLAPLLYASVPTGRAGTKRPIGASSLSPE
jgi:hypothetical protein